MKKIIATLMVAVAVLALILPVSAVPIGSHDITFVSHTFDGTYSTWTYNVTSGSKPALSHWVITWCNKSALIECSEDCKYVINDPGNTGLTGIKFDKGYSDSESRIVWFKLLGDWPESDMVYVGTKAAGNIDYGYVKGPVCTGPTPSPTPSPSPSPTSTPTPIPTTTLIGIIALAGLLSVVAAMSISISIRRRKE